MGGPSRRPGPATRRPRRLTSAFERWESEMEERYKTFNKLENQYPHAPGRQLDGLRQRSDHAGAALHAAACRRTKVITYKAKRIRASASGWANWRPFAAERRRSEAILLPSETLPPPPIPVAVHASRKPDTVRRWNWRTPRLRPQPHLRNLVPGGRRRRLVGPAFERSPAGGGRGYGRLPRAGHARPAPRPYYVRGLVLEARSPLRVHRLQLAGRRGLPPIIPAAG